MKVTVDLKTPETVVTVEGVLSWAALASVPPCSEEEAVSSAVPCVLSVHGLRLCWSLSVLRTLSEEVMEGIALCLAPGFAPKDKSLTCFDIQKKKKKKSHFSRKNDKPL